MIRLLGDAGLAGDHQLQTAQNTIVVTLRCVCRVEPILPGVQLMLFAPLEQLVK